MQALGVDLDTIQSIGGHADIDMTHTISMCKRESVRTPSRAFSSETTGLNKPTDGASKVLKFPRVG